MSKAKGILRGLLYKLLAFIAKLCTYYLVSRGMNIVDPNDVQVYTSLVHKGKIAPKGYVFYIAKLKLYGTLYNKNVAINRQNIPRWEEAMLIRKCQRIFANGITKRINK